MSDPLPIRAAARRAGAALLLPLLLGACAAEVAPVTAVTPESFPESTELAIACRHDEALAALDRTEAARGGATSASELHRVVLLRDAGRALDAERVLRERNSRPDVSADDAVYSGNAVVEGLDSLRAARTARTGRPHCG
ncbi:hypothetical protein PVT71_09320 [Salipiger sp. H15]|uniref:Lipoprotein n=1 Tax=Alloyangia sp. H15 TaxID=3029062 RepID=A0AAU8AEN5_9RHOB